MRYQRNCFKVIIIIIIIIIPPVGSGASENRLTALLQVVEGDQNRTRAHQRLKTGDLRRPLQRNRKGIWFLSIFAKIESNMKTFSFNLLVSSNPRFCVENGRETMMIQY